MAKEVSKAGFQYGQGRAMAGALYADGTRVPGLAVSMQRSASSAMAGAQDHGKAFHRT